MSNGYKTGWVCSEARHNTGYLPHTVDYRTIADTISGSLHARPGQAGSFKGGHSNWWHFWQTIKETKYDPFVNFVALK